MTITDCIMLPFIAVGISACIWLLTSPDSTWRYPDVDHRSDGDDN